MAKAQEIETADVVLRKDANGTDGWHVVKWPHYVPYYDLTRLHSISDLYGLIQAEKLAVNVLFIEARENPELKVLGEPQ